MTANNSVFEPVLMALVGDLCSQYEKAEIAGRLKPEYFIDPIQHEIFSAIQRLVDAGEEVCPFTIWEGFDPDTELFQQIRAYCLELSDSSTSIANIEPYIDRAIQVGMDGEIGRFIQAELVRINRADLTAVEKRDEIEDALDDSRELFVNQAPELVPTMEQQWKLMSDCVFNPVPDTEFIFKDQIIPKEELTVMPAFNGAGKSFMALQIAICKAIGKTFMVDENGYTYFDPIKAGRALILSVEDDSTHYSRRTQDIIEHFPSITEKDKHQITKNLFFRSFSEMSLDGQLTARDPKTGSISKSRTWRKIKKMIINGNFELVVIDPLHYCINAGDENSNADMGQAIQVLIQLAKDTGAAILSPCHTSEANPIKPRGATSITDRCRSMLTLATVARILDKKVVCSMPDLREIKCDFSSVLRFAMAKNSHGQLMTNYWLFQRMRGGVMIPIIVKSKQIDLENIIVQILGDGEMSQTSLIKEIFIEHDDLGIGEKTLKRRISEMVDAKVLRCQIGVRSAKILSVNIAEYKDEWA